MAGADYKCVLTGGKGEITEKKSRFIASVAPVSSEEDALSFLEEIRRENRTARHNCYAYTYGTAPAAMRFSDDGEPSGTAGRPILDVLANSDLFNTAIVVTRYFGGILLGTGGLVRAYTEAAKQGLAACEIVTKVYGRRLVVKTDYNGLGKLSFLAPEHGVFLLDTDYSDLVLSTVFVPAGSEQAFRNAVTDQTGGKALITELEYGFCAKSKDRIRVFPD